MILFHFSFCTNFIDSKLDTAVVLIDTAMAFDCVDHDL